MEVIVGRQASCGPPSGVYTRTSLLLGLNITCPVGKSRRRLQYSLFALFGGSVTCTSVLVAGSYSKKWIGFPQSLLRNCAAVTSTLPFGIKAAGQSLHT